MSHFPPSIFLLWSILTATLAVFYVYHIWHFDRFQCLRLPRRPYNGAFARFMSYSYIAGVLFLLVHSVGNAVIKYAEGYIALSPNIILPKPVSQWTPAHQAALYPLNIMLALAWGTEAVTHLEELCFWFFLIHSGPSPTSWFKSIYFNVWIAGSIMAMVVIPTVTAITKNDPLKNEAWLYLAGSTSGLIITLLFLPILWVFPSFIQNVKIEGAETATITRLATFHDLNIIRVFFRLLFVVSIFILSVDGLNHHSHVLNNHLIWSDLLLLSASIGFVIQSGITLLIFFPRNIELETQRWLQDTPGKQRNRVKISAYLKSKKNSENDADPFQEAYDRPRYLLTDSPVSSTHHIVPESSSSSQPHLTSSTFATDDRAHTNSYLMTSVHRQTDAQESPAVHPLVGRVNPLVYSFTSPINIDPSDFPRAL